MFAKVPRVIICTPPLPDGLVPKLESAQDRAAILGEVPREAIEEI